MSKKSASRICWRVVVRAPSSSNVRVGTRATRRAAPRRTMRAGCSIGIFLVRLLHYSCERLELHMPKRNMGLARSGYSCAAARQGSPEKAKKRSLPQFRADVGELVAGI